MENIVKEIKVELNKNDEPVVRGRVLHKALKIKTQYTVWFERTLEYGFTEYEDYIAINQKRLTAQGNTTTYTDHILTFDMAKEVSMIQRNEEGKKYRKYFIQKEKELQEIAKQRKTPLWANEREAGKLVRRAETDIIKDYLVPYAVKQGSQNYNKLYITYTKLANNTVGITNRSLATTTQLRNLAIAENIIENVIKIGIKGDLHYKDIYQQCKERLKQFKEIAFLE